MSIRTWLQFSARRLMSRRRRGVIWSAAHTCPSPASVTCALLERAMSGCRSTTYRESTQPFSSELVGIRMTFLRLTPVIALTFCASFAQAQSTAPKELSALLASQAAAEALTSCDKLGHKVSVTVLDRNGLTRAVLKHERATPHTLDSSRGKAYT